ncbi:hypothetical protein Sjap_024718 [Stephania japonica]|uniref:FAD-binding PCMH-type domain-containing protein n=1 Tax=Stephania japonica TaxID=461633 RepID=A0AAP0EDV9_9MAGN
MALLQFQPYGGRMSEISNTETPFPHRAGNAYKKVYTAQLNQVSNDNNIDWSRRLYKYMTPYVSKSPRAAYLNASDLNLGQNKMWTNCTPTYDEVKIWGSKYFKNNFDRLVKVKSRVDPDNFFRDEQSSPPKTPSYGSFLKCLSIHSHNYGNPIPVYTPNNSSFSSILNSRIQNLRFLSTKYPKPYIITTPLNESHVQTIVICSRKHGFFIRIRSGGHDYEGLSYTSPLTNTPFVLLDLSNLNSINVDIDKRTAWVQTGATIGQLYYRIAEKSPVHALAAGACTTIGVGGHFSGGGNGFLTRKYGLSADNIVDARIVNVESRILSRDSMGEDLFWAIRGGGGTSFGVILSWKINLVAVPPNVTVFSVSRTLEQGATDLVHKWQYIAYKLPKDLALFASLTKVNASNTTTTTTGQASFQALFLGGTTELLEIMQQNFSELSLKREDCIEMSWIQSVLFFAGLPTSNVSLNAFEANVLISNFKGASDYVKQPISKTGLQGIWRNIVKMSSTPILQLQAYGGIMSEISDTSIPFPHRAGNTYKILYLVNQNQGSNSDSNIEGLRRLYKYMTPYVSKSPRAAYLNARDLDLGHNEM